MDIVGLFFLTKQGSHSILVNNVRYFKSTYLIPTSRKTATHTGNVLLSQLLFPYGNVTYLFIKNGTQLASKFFTTLCTLLGIKCLKKKCIVHRPTATPSCLKRSTSCVFDTTSPNIEKTKIQLCDHFHLLTSRRSTGLQTKHRSALSLVDTH